MSDLYDCRGVSSTKADLHSAIQNLEKGIEPSSFCKIINDPENPEHGIILHSDGAGTKSSLAYAYWRETGDLNVWKGIAHDALIMNIDDMICAGVCNNFFVSSTIGRNKFLINSEILSTIIEGTKQTIDLLNSYGIECYYAGGETADVGDLVRTIIVDATVYARIHKDDIIANSRIQPGDVIVGLSSFGQAIYEQTYNSGIGSNGLTMARHEIFNRQIGIKYPETYDSNIPSELAYRGNYNLTDPSPIEGIDMGKFVLSPTRTYAPIVVEIFKNYRSLIHGAIHCTGGGQTKVMRFVKKVRIIKNNLFPIPDIFRIIQDNSRASHKEMLSIFNMGHRLELYVPNDIAFDIVKISKKFNVEARIVGYCEESERPELIIEYFGNRYLWQL